MTNDGLSGDDSVEIRAYDPADESGVLEVLQAAFEKWPHGISGVEPAAFFRWKMTECPFGPSFSLVALHQGQVIGFLGQLRWLFRLRGQSVQSVRGVDLAVDPIHRRRGISVAMMRRAIENNGSEVELTWNNPNSQSRPGLMKTGRRKIVVLPRFIQLRGALGQAVRRVPGRKVSTPDELPVEAETAAAVLGDGDYVSQVLSEIVEPSDRLVTARNLDYLRWRYGRFGSYHAFRVDTSDCAPGIAIFTLRRRESQWVSEVCELLVAGDDHTTKRRLIGEVRRSAPADLISASFGSRAEALRCGFLPVRGGALVTVRKIRDDLGVELTERNAWALSLGDVDLL